MKQQVIDSRAGQFRKILAHKLKFSFIDESNRKVTYIADRIYNLRIDGNKICNDNEVIASLDGSGWVVNLKAETFKKRYDGMHMSDLKDLKASNVDISIEVLDDIMLDTDKIEKEVSI